MQFRNSSRARWEPRQRCQAAGEPDVAIRVAFQIDPRRIGNLLGSRLADDHETSSNVPRG